MVRINEVMGDGFKPFRTHEQILRNYKDDSNRQIKIILLNNRRPLFRRAYRGGNVKIILILIEDNKQNSRKHEHIRQMIYGAEDGFKPFRTHAANYPHNLRHKTHFL